MDDWIAALDEAATRVADHLTRLKQLIVAHDDRLDSMDARLTALETGPTDPDGPLPEPDDTPTSPIEISPEPAGFHILAKTSFTMLAEGGFRSGELNGGRINLGTGGSGLVARATFPVGMGDGVAPVYSEADIRKHEVRSVFVSFRFKLSPEWQGHEDGVNKVMLMWTHEQPVVVANVWGMHDDRLSSEIRIQDVPDGADNLGPNCYVGSDIAAGPEIVRGQWHQWNVLLVSNEGDEADGEIHWWIDGRKVGEYTDIRFGTAKQSKIWDYVMWRPVWGGRGDRIEVEQYMWMDYIYVSGA